jgi:hypothetical protein
VQRQQLLLGFNFPYINLLVGDKFPKSAIEIAYLLGLAGLLLLTEVDNQIFLFWDDHIFTATLFVLTASLLISLISIALTNLPNQFLMHFSIVVELFVLFLQFLVLALGTPDYLFVLDDLLFKVVRVAFLALLELDDVLRFEHHSDFTLDLANEIFLSG